MLLIALFRVFVRKQKNQRLLVYELKKYVEYAIRNPEKVPVESQNPETLASRKELKEASQTLSRISNIEKLGKLNPFLTKIQN